MPAEPITNISSLDAIIRVRRACLSCTGRSLPLLYYLLASLLSAHEHHGLVVLLDIAGRFEPRGLLALGGVTIEDLKYLHVIRTTTEALNEVLSGIPKYLAFLATERSQGEASRVFMGTVIDGYDGLAGSLGSLGGMAKVIAIMGRKGWVTVVGDGDGVHAGIYDGGLSAEEAVIHRGAQGTIMPGIHDRQTWVCVSDLGSMRFTI